jgi:hypothetical protein
MRLDEKCMFALRIWAAFGTLLVLTSLPLVIVPGVGVAEENQLQALSAMAEAEADVVSAYQAVANADAAGANVSDLMVRLNEAGDYLTRAHAAYARGDSDSALELANSCQEKLVGFVADADAFAEVAVRDNNLDFFVNVVCSIVGSVGVVCGGFFVWLYIDRKHGKNGSQAQ